MSKTIQVGGDSELLYELSRELKTHGIESAVWSTSFAAADAEAAYEVLKIAAGASAAWAVVSSFLKHRKGHISLQCGEDKIDVEGQTAEEAIRMLEAGVYSLRKIRRHKKKDDA